jgi:hypothetical protein
MRVQLHSCDSVNTIDGFCVDSGFEPLTVLLDWPQMKVYGTTTQAISISYEYLGACLLICAVLLLPLFDQGTPWVPSCDEDWLELSVWESQEAHLARQCHLFSDCKHYKHLTLVYFKGF